VKVKNWSEFQHYKKRCPPWIKLHHDLLDNYEFHCLPVASRALAPCLWLLASESKDGTFPGDVEKISFRLHIAHSELVESIKPLIAKGFFEWEQGDSELLAECVQDATPETEGETETETDKPVKAKFKPPSLEEVSTYCKERNNRVNPQTFIDYHETRAWKLKGNVPMKDWKAAVRTWESNGFSNGNSPKKQVPMVNAYELKMAQDKAEREANELLERERPHNRPLF